MKTIFIAELNHNYLWHKQLEDKSDSRVYHDKMFFVFAVGNVEKE